MKKTFKFMTMALAAVVMAVGTVSCDQNDKTPEITSTPDGALWSFDFMYSGLAEASAVLDLRASEESAPVVYFYCTALGSTSYSPLIVGTYTVNPTDNESGTIVITVEDTNASSLTINYSGLTETSMTLSCESEVLTLENATATKTDESILAPTPSPDGKQWVYADPSFGGSMGYFYDFGVTEPYVIYEGYLMIADNTPTSPVPASYMIQPTDETSGVIFLIGGAYYGEGVEYAYRNLTETTVEIEATLYDMTAEAGTFITLTLASQPIIIE